MRYVNKAGYPETGLIYGRPIWTCPGGVRCVICREHRRIINERKNYFLYIPFSIQYQIRYTTEAGYPETELVRATDMDMSGCDLYRKQRNNLIYTELFTPFSI